MTRRRTPNLKRRPHKQEPKQRFIIYCEGQKTEPAYFAALKRFCANALIEVKTIAPAGVPFTLASAAADRAKSLRRNRRGGSERNSFEENDQVWAVFDRDEHPRFDDAVDLCQRAAVGIARSNPCFEFWLILHEEDYDRPDDRHAVQAHLKRLRPEYDRDGTKTPDCADLIARVDAAEARAERQLARRVAERTPHGPPSTTVGLLTREIRQAAERAR